MGKQNIQLQLTKIITVVYLTTTIIAFAFVYIALSNKVQELGLTFSTQYLLKEKSVISGPIEREVALALKLADTPIVKQWAVDEGNDALKELALRELENYRKHFQDRSYFFIIDQSKNYYFNDQDGIDLEEHYKYTLDKLDKNDEWYFNTMTNTEHYSLNVNVDRVLKTTKVWINTIVYDENNNKIGLAGTGISLDTFLDEFINNSSKYVTPLFIDENGFIMAYEDAEYIQHAALIREQAQSEKTIFELIGNQQIHQVKNIMQQLKNSDNNEETHTIQVKFGHEDRIAALSYLPALDWYIVVLLNTSEIFSIWDFAPTMVVLLMALLVISLAIMYFIRRMIISPINELTDFSKQISKKNYQHRLKMSSNNEFQLLANSFNNMSREIQDYTANLEKQVSIRTEELTLANAELSCKNQNLIDNISYALYLQQAILPEEDFLSSKLTEHFVLWLPKDIVGGDFYWFKECEQQLLIAVIDCTGHGVPGALMTMNANALLNRIVDIEHQHSPADILNRFDMAMRDVLRKDMDEFQRDDGLDISLCAIDKHSGKITFAGAGMDMFYVDLDNPDNILHVKGDRFGIGYKRQRRSIPFTNKQIESTKVIVYLTSDGYLDQNGGPLNKRFSRQGFIELLKSVQGQDLSVQRETLRQEIAKYMDIEPQRDDITVVGFRI